MKNFFTETLKRREKEAGTQGPEPTPAKPVEQPSGTASFFYDTPAELRKKAGKQPK